MSEHIIERTSRKDGYTWYTETIEREEIVRCKDCESYQPGMYEHFTCEYLHRWAKPDDFCAWGERKD